MLAFRTIKSLNQCLCGYRAPGPRIGFVPTMRFLHAGHRALITESVARCLSRGLLAAQAAYQAEERHSQSPVEKARAHTTEVDQLQYFELNDAETLEAVQGLVEQPAALCFAAYFGTMRLIANVIPGFSPSNPDKARSDLTNPPSAVLERLSSGVA
jgi:pantothenate synthetase